MKNDINWGTTAKIWQNSPTLSQTFVIPEREEISLSYCTVSLILAWATWENSILKKKKDKVGAHTPCITSLSQAALRTHPFITNKSFCVSILRKCFHTVQMVVVLFEEYYFLNLHTSAMPWLLCIFFVYLYGFLKSVCLPAFML